MTRDSLQLTLEGLEDYVADNIDKLQTKADGCNCADCSNPSHDRFCPPGGRMPPKLSWMDLLDRRDDNSVDYIMGQCLCPRREYECLTLPEDEKPFKMHLWECGHLQCCSCGPSRRLQWNCPVFHENVDLMEYWDWKKEDSTAGVQREMVKRTRKVKDVMAELQSKIEECIIHESEKAYLNRTRHIDVETFDESTMLICTDFSAMMDLRPNRTKCAHVDKHAVLAIFYVFTNPRFVTTESGDTIRISDCDVWHVFGNAEDANTKNDHVFHNASLDYIMEYYTKTKGLTIKTVRVWTDNCSGQYKCRQNFYKLSKIPQDTDIDIAEHCFAQVYSFKGPWDAAGKVIKYYIRKLERMEKERVKDAFHCYRHSTKYFEDNLPGGNDWTTMENELSDKLKDKTPYSTVNRFAAYATDNTDQYNKLVSEGHAHIINTHRSKAKDTAPYNGSSDCHYFKGTGEETNAGIHLIMQSKPCRCNYCRRNGDCPIEDIRGEAVDFYRRDKEVVAAEQLQKKKDALNKAINIVKDITNLLPIRELAGKELKALVAVMNAGVEEEGQKIKVVRRDGEKKAPKNSDWIAALEEENLTDNAVQSKINQLVQL